MNIKNPPQLLNYSVEKNGIIDGIHFELRLNGICEDLEIKRAFFACDSANKPFLIVMDESNVPGINQRLLKIYTAHGFDVRLANDDLDSFFNASQSILHDFMKDPESFIPVLDINESHVLPALVDFPHVLDSKIVETGSLSGYRYELHTDCDAEPGLLHALFVYSPHESDPCMAITLDEDNHSVLRVLTAKKDRVLGRRRDLRNLDAFHQASLKELNSFLNPKNSGTHAVEMPVLLESDIVETGHLGVFRCELHTDCYSESEIKYIHVFYFFIGNGSEPKIAFSLEKSPRSPRPVMVLTFGTDRTEFGYDPELLDPKVFRDRSISLAKLALNKAELNNVDIPPDAIESILKVDSAYTLSGCVLVVYGLVWVALNAYDFTALPMLESLSSGFLAMTGGLFLFMHLKLLRHMGIGFLQRFFRTALLFVPTVNFLLAGLAFLQARQKMKSFGLNVGLGGLSLDETRMMEAKLAASKIPVAKPSP